MSRHKALLSDILRENPQLSEIEISEITGLTFNEIQDCLLSMAQSAKQACLPKTPQVLCIGGANVDRKIQAVQTLIYGSSNPARSSISCGGVARNVAENLGRLGCSPSLLSFIGNDAEGQWLIGKTKEFVNIHSVGVVDGKSTGTYTAILDLDGEMAVALADMEIYDDVDIDLLQSKWAADFRTDLIVIDTNFPADVLEKIINRPMKQVLLFALHLYPLRKLGNYLHLSMVWLG
ncbi:PfkB family carbohydrate kinase [Neobacillus sp. PS3-34]|uniref:PfkB family carbohydrate kinase n=1 Tax=Neobacillus sp. PS3-34 TaxID=3070678 RepID=UPI0027DEC87B|nr:PfkB family carbohydrate kinase [Neobacillus sp. PS3-34]WML50558.1 PfkB family carbohydrate kinase [Neobacillus sp. PS3-34]